MTLQVVDRFTTRDGLWEVDPRPYGITKEMLDKYGGLDIPGKGGAAHIFVNAPANSMVKFYTTDGNNINTKIVDDSGWCNFNLWASSAYWGENKGPWIVNVSGVEVAEGLGLPEGYHVSTFLIVEDVKEGSQPDTPSTPPVGVSHIQVLVNGVVKSEFWI